PPSESAPSERLHAAWRNLEQLARLDRQRGGSRRRDESLAASSDPSGQDSAPLGIELRENVVEEEQRRRAGSVEDQLGLSEQQRQDCEPLLAVLSLLLAEAE